MNRAPITPAAAITISGFTFFSPVSTNDATQIASDNIPAACVVPPTACCPMNITADRTSPAVIGLIPKSAPFTASLSLNFVMK